ncbi:MAG: response regulator transcription factor [Gammaproteobacteria bacterium]|nr:response regulator transcription factor [Gammaproteobacteria bacterium]
MHKGKILSIEDDKNLQLVVNEYLQEDGYEVLLANDFATAVEKITSEPVNVVLLDLVLPDGDGLNLISTLKAHSNAAIIVLSGKDNTMEKVVCLEMGADDYLTKPFEMRELSARIKAVLRRVENRAQPVLQEATRHPKWRLPNGWILDSLQYQLFDETARPADLTVGEFRLLSALTQAANRVLTREQLFEHARKGDSFDVYDRAIDTQIARLRKKMGDISKPPNLIKTIRGVGYMLCGQVTSA